MDGTPVVSGLPRLGKLFFSAGAVYSLSPALLLATAGKSNGGARSAARGNRPCGCDAASAAAVVPQPSIANLFMIDGPND